MKKTDQIKWPTRTVLNASRGKTILFLIVSLGFVAIGVLLRNEFDEVWVAYACAGFFALCAAVFLIQLFKPGHLIFTAEGFEQKMLGRVKSYRWDEVSDFSIMTVRSGLFNAASFVTFSKINDSDTVMNSVAMKIGGGTQSLGDNFGLKTEKLRDIMSDYRQTALRNAPKSWKTQS